MTPESWFQDKVWPGVGVTIQHGILTKDSYSMCTSNSSIYDYLLPVELRIKKVSKSNSLLKIQQLRRVIIQRNIHQSNRKKKSEYIVYTIEVIKLIPFLRSNG